VYKHEELVIHCYNQTYVTDDQLTLSAITFTPRHQLSTALILYCQSTRSGSNCSVWLILGSTE